MQSQQLCDEDLCIVRSDLYDGKNEKEVLSVAVKEKVVLEERGHIFDISCNYPSFWYFNTKGKKVIKEAKAIGMTLLVSENEKGQRCDIATSPKFVQIEFIGNNFAVTDYYGDAVFVDKSFINIIMDKKYWCYGLPLEPTKYVKCKICDKIYKKQSFKSKDGELQYIYINASGKCTNGKNHDNLKLEPIGSCDVTKGRTVPTN